MTDRGSESGERFVLRTEKELGIPILGVFFDISKEMTVLPLFFRYI